MLEDPIQNRDNLSIANKQSPSVASSSLTSLESTPSRDIWPPTRSESAYDDDILPNSRFWVQIDRDPEFNRDEFEVDEQEFNVVGIFGEVGEHDDLQYEVQFEDDHTTTVVPS